MSPAIGGGIPIAAIIFGRVSRLSALGTERGPMLRLFLGLLLILSGGAAAAQHRPAANGCHAQAGQPRRKRPPRRPAQAKSPIARELFGAAAEPAPLAARSIGGYAKGCLAVCVAADNGPDWP